MNLAKNKAQSAWCEFNLLAILTHSRLLWSVKIVNGWNTPSSQWHHFLEPVWLWGAPFCQCHNYLLLGTAFRRRRLLDGAWTSPQTVVSEWPPHLFQMHSMKGLEESGCFRMGAEQNAALRHLKAGFHYSFLGPFFNSAVGVTLFCWNLGCSSIRNVQILETVAVPWLLLVWAS